MKEFIIKLIVGKNLPHLGRVAVTALGSLLLSTALFSPETAALDSTLGEAVELIGAPAASDIDEGVTFGEFARAILGIGLIWFSRFLSYLRAKNLDWLANLVGPLLGRSVPSLIRALLVGVGTTMAYFTKEPSAAPEILADQPVASLVTAAGSFLLANFLSGTEDAKRNPVK